MQDKNYLMVQFYYYKYELNKDGVYIGIRRQKNSLMNCVFFDNNNHLRFIINEEKRPVADIYKELYNQASHLSRKNWATAEIKAKSVTRYAVMTGHVRGLVQDEKYNELNKNIDALQFGSQMAKNKF